MLCYPLLIVFAFRDRGLRVQYCTQSRSRGASQACSEIQLERVLNNLLLDTRARAQTRMHARIVRGQALSESEMGVRLEYSRRVGYMDVAQKGGRKQGGECRCLKKS